MSVEADGEEMIRILRGTIEQIERGDQINIVIGLLDHRPEAVRMYCHEYGKEEYKDYLTFYMFRHSLVMGLRRISVDYPKAN